MGEGADSVHTGNIHVRFPTRQSNCVNVLCTPLGRCTLFLVVFHMSFTSRLLFSVVIILVMGVPMKKGLYSLSFVVSCNLFIIFIYTCIFFNYIYTFYLFYFYINFIYVSIFSPKGIYLFFFSEISIFFRTILLYFYHVFFFYSLFAYFSFISFDCIN